MGFGYDDEWVYICNDADPEGDGDYDADYGLFD